MHCLVRWTEYFVDDSKTTYYKFPSRQATIIPPEYIYFDRCLTESFLANEVAKNDKVLQKYCLGHHITRPSLHLDWSS